MNNQQWHQLLKQEFGFDHFRPGQLPTLQALSQGQNVLAILPTGSGKTLIYQLMGKVVSGLIVVVSPLLSLMQDQVNRLRLAGNGKVGVLNSLVDFETRAVVLNHLSSYDYLFLSPEMVTTEEVIGALQRCHLSLMVIDEAHCVSEWGPDFRPHYLLLKETLSQLGQPLTLMLTATATPHLAADLIQRLGFTSDQVAVVRESVDRSNIFLAVEQVENDQTKRLVLAKLVKHYGGRGIVYFSSRKLASQMAMLLSEETGMVVAPYHAGIDGVQRYRVQRQFMADEVQVICATSAFGMGIDKDDVRYVIHYHMPKSMAAYVQEIGRAGRNGQQTLAVLLYAPGDEQLQLALADPDLPSSQMIEQYRKQQLPQAQLGKSAELITFYLDHGWDIDQLEQLFARRWQLARRQIGQMLAYAQGKVCLRQMIANHFEETLEQKPLACCSVDQPNWLSTLKIAPGEKAFQAVEQLNWSKRLKKLFNLSDELDSQ